MEKDLPRRPRLPSHEYERLYPGVSRPATGAARQIEADEERRCAAGPQAPWRQHLRRRLSRVDQRPTRSRQLWPLGLASKRNYTADWDGIRTGK